MGHEYGGGYTIINRLKENMGQPINGNELIALGYKPGPCIGVALKINRRRNGFRRDEMLEHYKNVLENPEQYIDNPVFGKLASALIEERDSPVDSLIALKPEPESYGLFGGENIESGAKEQMAVAMSLPVTVGGALMPDAHQGYGLPIGGVLAVKNAVFPYGVGVDIGCRMALSIYDIPEPYFLENRDSFRSALLKNTKFGAGNGFAGKDRADHAVLENELFGLNGFIGSLRDKAWMQLGTSGGGNHFVEFGVIEFDQDDHAMGIDKGRYVALLTHSGSSGLGATIAGHYTKLAKQLCRLPYEAANLAYLPLDSQEGMEYWLAMNLAGDYASACHEIIHQKLAKAIGANILASVENHHNFAWKELWNGEEVIVHRKGATPAAHGVPGIIPGSMATPGFLVRGKGNVESIHSASHGAGRQMSRTAAIKNLSKKDMKAILQQRDISLIGGDIDEAPMAYKDIHKVMAAQEDLVDIVASFMPKLVQMADDGTRED
jgi:tRNA-splicing ligase RtcB